MNKLDYLKYAISQGCHKKKAWLVSVFGTIKEETNPLENSYPGKIIKKAWGYAFVNSSAEIVDLEGFNKEDRVVFTFKEPITVDSSWCENAKEPVQTTIGNLIFNLLAMVPAFNSKIPFVTGRVSISAIEDIVATKLRDTPELNEPRSTEYIYVDEYLKFCDALTFISGLSQLTCWAATHKNVRGPTGIKEFKAQLLTKYEGKLTDPVELAKFEQELVDFDGKYLEGDPSFGTLVTGKVRNVARKKMYLSLGSEKDFSGSLKATPVINSLEEGWPTDPEQFVAMMNGLRFGSFSRGSETVKGGVSAKILLRAANNFKIIDTDCGTQLGIRRNFNQSNINKLIGRYVLDKTSTLVENNDVASNYLNKDIVVRSPMFCKLEGDRICKICAGTRLSQFPTGMGIPVTEISSIILAASMAAMHAQVLSTAKLDFNKHFS